MTIAGVFRKILSGLTTALGIAPNQSRVFVPNPHEIFGAPISQEADEFLTTCNTDFNESQERFSKKWLQNCDCYDVDLERGVFWLSYKSRKTVEFDVSVAGSIRKSSQTWEWAWNNPNANSRLSVSKSILNPIGNKFGLRYLTVGMLPVPDEQFGWYLSGIVLHLEGGEGVYMADGEGYEAYLILKNPRLLDS